MTARKKNANKPKKKRRIKKYNIFLLILTIILTLVVILNTYLILKFNILPNKFLIPYFVLIIGIPSLLLLFLYRKKTKKKMRITLTIISILFAIIMGFLFFYLNKTYNFIDAFTSGYNYETKNYLVIVLKDSKYQKIGDLKSTKIGYMKGKNIDLAIDKLYDEIPYQKMEYENYQLMLEDLDKKEISSIMVLDTYYEVISEENKDFEDKHRVIFKFSVTEKTKEIKKEADVTKDVFNIYISGIDTYNNISSVTRSDVNIVASINPRTNQVLLINIPRDYYVTLPDFNQKDKLTHAGMYGTEESVKTLENLLGIEINYYVKVNYTALVKLVDTLGGVDVYSKYTFTTTFDRYNIKKGYNHVNGIQALQFVRTRKAFSDGDRVRGENQQAMIQAILKKAVNPTILAKYSDVLASLEGSFITNMSTNKITDLVKMQLDRMPSWNLTSISLNGGDSYEYTYTYPYQKLYVMTPNEETVELAKKTLEDVKNGIILDSSYTEEMTSVNTPTQSPKPSKNKKPSSTNTSKDKDKTKEEDKTTENKETNDTTSENKTTTPEVVKPEEDKNENNKTEENNNKEEKDPVEDLMPKDDESKD